MRKLIIVILLLVNGPLYADSPGDDGNLVLRHCKTWLQFIDETLGRPPESGDAAGMGFCIGMFEGVTQTMIAHGTMCQPKGGLKREQALRVIVKYLEDHPADLHENGAGLMASALLAAFPCN